MSLMDEHELLAWVHDHRGKLHDISVRLGADERMIQGLALMVLSGYTDAEVYEDLQHELLVWDCRRDPRLSTRVARPRKRRQLRGPGPHRGLLRGLSLGSGCWLLVVLIIRSPDLR